MLDKWLAIALEAYGGVIAQRAATESDPFRNPIGHVLRANMTILLAELLGAMDPAAVEKAFADIIAVRAIQGLSVEQALGFVYALRGIVRAELPHTDTVELDARIDRLSLAAFTQYVRCRERLSELRFNERLRSLGAAPVGSRRPAISRRGAGA